MSHSPPHHHHYCYRNNPLDRVLPHNLVANDAAKKPHSACKPVRDPIPVAEILRQATVMERAKLGSPVSQAGWHVHGTHVFAIPFTVVSANPAVQDRNSAQSPSSSPSSPSAPPADEARVQNDGNPADVLAGEGPYRVVFDPSFRAEQEKSDEQPSVQTPGKITALWILHHPEFQRWLWEQETRQQQGQDTVERESQLESLLRFVDAARCILARWDHHELEYKV